MELRRLDAKKRIQKNRIDGYNPDQPRAENGQFGEGGGGGSNRVTQIGRAKTIIEKSGLNKRDKDKATIFVEKQVKFIESGMARHEAILADPDAYLAERDADNAAYAKDNPSAWPAMPMSREDVVRMHTEGLQYQKAEIDKLTSDPINYIKVYEGRNQVRVIRKRSESWGTPRS